MSPNVPVDLSAEPPDPVVHHPPRAEDDVSALDRQAAAVMARLWSGLSPISIALASTDWALHLASSPGSQLRLARQAWEQGVAWLVDALQAGLGQACAGPAQLPGPVPAQPAAAGPGSALAEALLEDQRFAAQPWQLLPWRSLATAHKSWEAWWLQACSLRGMQLHSRDQMRFYGLQLLDMLAPSNALASNPEALQAAWRSGGQSLLRGVAHLLDELPAANGRQGGTVTEPDIGPGRGLAMTPGRVVLRNDLIELIQYQPATPSVHAEPVLIVPSCIMKYYILDLSPHNSLVRWLVGQGHTVAILSWRNPDESDALLGMDDYVRDGVLAALDHLHCATGRPVHLAGYCLGGTFAAIAAAALAGGDAQACLPGNGQDQAGPLASLTLLAAETDFSEPGEMGVLIDEAQVHQLEEVMAARGYLSGREMAASFQFLRSRELVWSSRTRRWLLGEDEVPNELMIWNADLTRLPAVMHSQYLGSCFLRNDLAEGRYLFQGQPISLRDIRVPVFAVGTVKDHVSPWHSCYKVHRLVSAEVTFALTNGGHNAGIVSEPGHPGRHYQLLTTPLGQPWRTSGEWLEAAPRCEGSWWTAWDQWLAARGSGEQVAARKPPEDDALGAAPGRYVLQRYDD
jgi:polyhydroxyalkanoate synthase subunit PhaC